MLPPLPAVVIQKLSAFHPDGPVVGEARGTPGGIHGKVVRFLEPRHLAKELQRQGGREGRTHAASSRNSTQLPSGSATMAMRMPGRISVLGMITEASAAFRLSTRASRSVTVMVQ